MAYLLLLCAIAAEVAGTLTLRVAAAGRAPLYAVVAACYLIAFAALAATLRQGIPLGVAYGIWAAAGVAITAAASHLLFGEPLTRKMLAGIGFVITGVLLMEIGAAQ